MTTDPKIKRAASALHKNLTALTEGIVAAREYHAYSADFAVFGPRRAKFGPVSLHQALVVKSDSGDVYASDGRMLFGPIDVGEEEHDVSGGPTIEQVMPQEPLSEVSVVGREGEHLHLSTGWQLNPVYLEVARRFTGNNTLMQGSKPSGPLLVRGDGGTLAIIMPIRPT